MNTIKLNFLVILCYLICSFGMDAAAQDFNVTYVSGHQYSNKPSISARLQGTNEVVVVIPKNQSKVDQYYSPVSQIISDVSEFQSALILLILKRKISKWLLCKWSGAHLQKTFLTAVAMPIR